MGTTIVTVFEKYIASPTAWPLATFNPPGESYTDVTALLAAYGYDATAQAAVATALAASKRVRFFASGTIAIAYSGADGPGVQWRFGFNPFGVASFPAKGFVVEIEGWMAAAQTTDSVNFDFDIEVGSNYLADAKVADFHLNAVSNNGSGRAFAPGYFANGAPTTAHPEIITYFADRSGGDCTQFDVKVKACGIQIFN